MKKGTAAFKTIVLAICAVSAVLIYLGGCGGGGTGGDKGTLKLSIVDKPSDDYQTVMIAIREIRVVPAGQENDNDNDPRLPVLVRFATPERINVLDFKFIQKALGEVVLPAGTYNQIRLILEPNPGGQQDPENYLILKSDPNTKIALTTPSGAQSGLKVNGPITVTAGVASTYMIDFDPNTAIVQAGNSGKYNFKPTGIRLVKTLDLAQFGSILGNVTAFQQWSTATVSIKRRGTINDTDPIAAARIFANYTSGSWQAPFSAFVPASTYKTFISAGGFRVYSSPELTVTEGAATDIGNITLEQ